MAGHNDATLFTGRDNAVQEVFVIRAEIVRADGLIALQRGFEFSKAVRLPAGQRKAVAVVNRIADQVNRRHVAEILLIKVKAV